MIEPRPAASPTGALGSTVVRPSSEHGDSAERATAGTPGVTRIGHYVLLYELGRGGMGVVYAARDTKLDRRVAIKQLLGGRSGHRRRLIREALAMAKLSHPNVIPIYEIGEESDSTFSQHFERSRGILGPLAEASPGNADVSFGLVLAHLGLLEIAALEERPQTRREHAVAARAIIDAMDALGQVAGFQEREDARARVLRALAPGP